MFPGGITYFTENLIGALAEFQEVWANSFFANQAFIDTMAASQAYFGSEDTDQQTRVDGTGVNLYRRIEGEWVLAGQFGGGLTQLAFFGENETPTGSIGQEGDAAFRTLATDTFTVAGREVFPHNPPSIMRATCGMPYRKGSWTKWATQHRWGIDS